MVEQRQLRNHSIVTKLIGARKTGGIKGRNTQRRGRSAGHNKNEIQPAAGRNPAARDEIHTSSGRNLRAAPANDEAPKPFRFRGFIYPGSYLLSRDLSSDYHRRADVSLPGSEWDRVGPSGYDHQVSGSFSLLCSLLTSVIICACGFLWCFCWLPLWQQADIRVACVFVVVHSLPFYIPIKPNCLSPGCCIRSIGC